MNNEPEEQLSEDKQESADFAMHIASKADKVYLSTKQDEVTFYSYIFDYMGTGENVAYFGTPENFKEWYGTSLNDENKSVDQVN